MGAGGRHEPGGGGAEHELEQLAPLAAHLQAPAVLVHRRHRAPFEAAAEVRDARLGTNAGQWP